jgi:hypothetical protein
MPASFPNDPTSWLPPLQPWSGASESLIAAAGHPWITPAEKTGLTATPSYDESLAWLRRLCVASPLVSMMDFGRSAQGRPLCLVTATTEKMHTPEALRASGKPTLLVQAGIHPGEIEGKDAGLMLLRDLAFSDKATLLQQVNLLFIPVLNPDGHERASSYNRPNQRGPIRMGWRSTAQNLNLNREYLKASAPEMRALLALLGEWTIDLYLDIHATDGLDFQYDITYAYQGRAGSPSWSPRISEWLDRTFSTALDAELHAQGHLALNFYVTPVNKRDLLLGLRESQMSPRFSLGYGDLRHLPTVLIETHSLKPYRQRVLATCVFIEATMRHLAGDAAALRAAIAADRASRHRKVPLDWIGGGPQRELDFRGIDFEHYESPASGAREVRWLGRPRTFPKLPVFTDKAGIIIVRPVSYWVPVHKPEVIELLHLHGIAFETLDTDRTIDVTMYRVALSETAAPVSPDESRHSIRLAGVRREHRRETFPAGSIRIPTDQPLGDLAVILLEPMGPDSLLQWGFFNEIAHRTEYIEGYIIAPLAERMLGDDAKLKAEFEAKLAADPTFAADTSARLQWFYARTPFFDERHLLYPIGMT